MDYGRTIVLMRRVDWGLPPGFSAADTTQVQVEFAADAAWARLGFGEPGGGWQPEHGSVHARFHGAAVAPTLEDATTGVVTSADVDTPSAPLHEAMIAEATSTHTSETLPRPLPINGV